MTTAATPKTELKAVDISIAGTPHRVVCPSDEVPNLEQASDQINQKIRDFRREMKHRNPNNEELLVLVCLDLYDQVQALQGAAHLAKDAENQALSLIEKIQKDAQSVL